MQRRPNPARLGLIAGLTLGLLAIAGCAQRSEPPPAFAAYAANVQIAQVLAASCPDVTLDRAGMGTGARTLGETLNAEGYSPADIAAFPDTLDVGEIEERVRGWLSANGVDPADEASACTAAAREIEAASDIAAYLDAA